MITQKNARQVERVVKGFANHRRVRVLEMLDRQPGLTLRDIALQLRISEKTTSEHVRKMVIAGLVVKHYDNRWVRHKLTNIGKKILKFTHGLAWCFFCIPKCLIPAACLCSDVES